MSAEEPYPAEIGITDPKEVSVVGDEILNRVREVARRITMRLRNVCGEFEVDVPGAPTDEYPTEQQPPNDENAPGEPRA